ncbi:MAG: response regulator [Thiohalocapsa sp.]|nr:response regulator [Thiohalocapsa sp.]
MHKRILVIDDDSSVRDAFARALSNGPYEVAQTASGTNGADAALSSDFDLVFLDLDPADMDGVDVLRRIRGAKPDLPVYIVTEFHRKQFDRLVGARAEGLLFELIRKPLREAQIAVVAAGALSRTDHEYRDARM